jgi:hypothetical protein
MARETSQSQNTETALVQGMQSSQSHRDKEAKEAKEEEWRVGV